MVVLVDTVVVEIHVVVVAAVDITDIADMVNNVLSATGRISRVIFRRRRYCSRRRRCHRHRRGRWRWR